MNETIGVGIVGLSASGGWAAGAHLPALRAVDGFELRGVSASSAESAAAAAARYDVPLSFGNAVELASHEDIDLVVVAVKVPRHRELVEAVLGAGKMAFCEWPLGNGLAEAVELAANAEVRSVRTAVGLQARSSPTFRYLRDLIAGGYVGEVLSTTIVAAGYSWGREVPAPSVAYNLAADNGATLLTIPVAHTIDAAAFMLGEPTELTATIATRRPQVLDIATGGYLTMTAPDQVAVTARLEGGAVVSLHFRGGLCRGTNLLWEINGTEGDLVVAGPSGHVQLADLTIRGGRGTDTGLSELVVPESYQLVPAAAGTARVANVANAYAQLRGDLINGTTVVPTFEHGVHLHETIDAVMTAARATPISRRR